MASPSQPQTAPRRTMSVQLKGLRHCCYDRWKSVVTSPTWTKISQGKQYCLFLFPTLEISRFGAFTWKHQRLTSKKMLTTRCVLYKDPYQYQDWLNDLNVSHSSVFQLLFYIQMKEKVTFCRTQHFPISFGKVVLKVVLKPLKGFKGLKLALVEVRDHTWFPQ